MSVKNEDNSSEMHFHQLHFHGAVVIKAGLDHFLHILPYVKCPVFYVSYYICGLSGFTV